MKNSVFATAATISSNTADISVFLPHAGETHNLRDESAVSRSQEGILVLRPSCYLRTLGADCTTHGQRLQ